MTDARDTPENSPDIIWIKQRLSAIGASTSLTKSSATQRSAS